MSIQNVSATREWIKTPYEGIDISPVGGTEQVNTAAFRIAAAIELPPHTHPVWELVTVVSGKLRLGAATLGPGDLLHTNPGESHDVQAFEETVFLVTVGQDRQLG